MDPVSRFPDDWRDRLTLFSQQTWENTTHFLRELTVFAGTILQVSRSSAWLFTHDHSSVRCVELYERKRNLHSQGMTLRVTDFPEYFRSLQKQTDVSTAEALTDPQTRELAQAYLVPLGITSMLDTPVRVEGVVLGVLCQEEVGQSRKWTDAERQFLQELACLASRQLGNVCAESFAPGDAAERSQSSAMKQFAAGVGHDFRNLLTIIHGHASLIARMSHLDPRIRSATEKILEAAHRGEELSQELMQCGLADARPTRIIVAQEILNAVIELLRRQIPSSIDIHTDLHPQTSRVFMDPVQLERILINLLTNARDAMPAGGRITITLREEQLEEAENRTYVKITVKDTGCGMPPEILSRIFEPYYSTKPEGRGTGLGMVIVKQILERVGGMIKVRSTEGEGTAFHLYLPRVAAGD